MLIMKWTTDHEGHLVAVWGKNPRSQRTVTQIYIAPTTNEAVRSRGQKPYNWLGRPGMGVGPRRNMTTLERATRCSRTAWSATLTVMLVACLPLRGQDSSPNGSLATHRKWDFHYQSTLIGQGVLPFPAEYSGPNSLEPHGEVRDTFSFDVTAGVHLWRGAEFFADVLSWQGYGLSNTTGVAGFPNGEAYRVGKTFPDAVISRAYLRETVPLGSKGVFATPSERTNEGRRFVLQLGHFSAADVFDTNTYANNARTQFMNWALVNDVAWDYPANSLGVTNGLSAEMDLNSWSARAGIFQVSRMANALRMDWNLLHAWSAVGEIEKRHSFAGHPGAARLLAYDEHAHMGSYQQALSDPQNIAALGQLGYRSKYGFGINLEQEIHKDIGAFARLGWSDGRNQVWEFTDVDRTASMGISLKGEAWGQPADTLGIASVFNGITAVHRQFLANGGVGITVGDGKLDYGVEQIVEAYYSHATRWHVSVSPDFQLVVNPAYNRARGPAFIYALRLHWEN